MHKPLLLWLLSCGTRACKPPTLSMLNFSAMLLYFCSRFSHACSPSSNLASKLAGCTAETTQYYQYIPYRLYELYTISMISFGNLACARREQLCSCISSSMLRYSWYQQVLQKADQGRESAGKLSESLPKGAGMSDRNSQFF